MFSRIMRLFLCVLKCLYGTLIDLRCRHVPRLDQIDGYCGRRFRLGFAGHHEEFELVEGPLMNKPAFDRVSVGLFAACFAGQTSQTTCLLFASFIL
jgi:hypothetical protein